MKIIFGDIFPFMLGYGETAMARWWVSTAALLGIGMLVWRLIQVWKNRQRKTMQLPFLLSLFLVNFLMCIFCNELGNESNGRYMLPFYIAIPLGMAWFVECMPQWARAIAVMGIVACLAQAVKTNQLFCARSDTDNYVQLGHKLSMEGIRGGYADYWVAYKMTAITHETVIMAPIGYKNRYPPYIDYVGSLQKIVVLGGPLDPTRKTMSLLGHTYKLLQQRTQYGFLTTYLEQII